LNKTPSTDGAPQPPDGFESLLRQAVRLHNQGQLEAAERLYEQCLRRSTSAQATTLHLLGLIASQSGRLDQSVAAMEQAVQIDPGRPQFHHDLGSNLGLLRRYDEALAHHDQAIRLKPDYAEAHCDRGIALANLGRLEEAIASYDQAIALNPMLSAAFNNRGLTLHKLGRLDEAIRAFDQALSLKPDFPIAHYNRGRCLLLTGKIETGLKDFEWRKHCPGLDKYRPLPQPVWLGHESLSGKTVFVYPELYLGDMIQFCRYAPLLEKQGARVILAAQEKLHRLLTSISPTIDIVSDRANPTGIDYHCPLLSLPFALGTTLETIPNQAPYLRAEPERVQKWRRKIGDDGFKIGICWQGSVLPYADEMQRAFALTELHPIARRPEVRLISLQKHDGLEQLSSLPADMKVETLGDDFDSGPDAFLDAAAAMESMDLIITADTAIAHLAGALARPTWVALPCLPDWRWMLERPDSPWYPTMRLFRQASPGDWLGVFSDIEDALLLEMEK
jgi:Flp pilus assembly protein TadD